MQYKNIRFKKNIQIAGGLSLILLPLILMAAFALHYSNFSDFFIFKFTKEPYSASHLLNTLTSDDGGFRLYTLPHMAGYLALPLFISASLCLSYFVFEKKPWHSLIGAILTNIGTVFLGGVFGSWLSFASVKNTSGFKADNVLPVLDALTQMQGALMLSSILSSLTFIGMIILGFGLFQSRIVPKWSSALFTLGNILILVFIDIDNLMFVGALLIFIGMLPLCRKLICGNTTAHLQV